jgi:hypothetical protein
MDLSSLQNNLPRGNTKPSPPPSIPPPTLTADFKAAALAVTKLYQNSAKQVDQARQEGYLSAVQEVAALLSHGELAGDRLREWCAVGLSRITAQQDEENRTRRDDTQVDEDGGVRQRELTPPQSSPVITTARMQNPFAETQFTFQSPIPLPQMGYQSPFGVGDGRGGGMEQDVTFEVISEREGNGRKRTVNHQLGSIWDVSGWGGGGGGNKRTRHA